MSCKSMKDNNLAFPDQKVQSSSFDIKLPTKPEIPNLQTKYLLKESEPINMVTVHMYK